MLRKQLVAAVCLLLTGCTTLMGQQRVVSSCSVEQVWDASIAALRDFPLETSDKATAVLETRWVEAAASTQAGILERNVNRERMKYVVEVKPDGRGAVATVLQLREGWSPMGAQSFRWQAIPGNSSEEEAMASSITRRLKEKGC